MTNPRDRTQEFLREVRKRKPHFTHPQRHRIVSVDSDPYGSDPEIPPPKKSSSRFSQEVILVNSDLIATSEKLESLTKLVRGSTSFHNFHHAEISHLTMQVNDDIGMLKSRLGSLEINSGEIKTKRSGGKTRHHRNIITQLKGKYNRAVKSFQGVIKETQDNLTRQQKRGEKYSKAKRRELRPRLRCQSLLDLEKDEKAPLIQGGGSSELAQLLVTKQDSYHQVRAETVQSIEKAIVELAVMYERVAELVIEQGAVTERIDSNVQNSLENVEYGIAELSKYLSSVSTNRWLIIKVFAILIFFAMLFALLS